MRQIQLEVVFGVERVYPRFERVRFFAGHFLPALQGS